MKCIYPFLFSFYLNYVERIFQERDSKGLDSIDMEEEFRVYLKLCILLYVTMYIKNMNSVA